MKSQGQEQFEWVTAEMNEVRAEWLEAEANWNTYDRLANTEQGEYREFAMTQAAEWYCEAMAQLERLRDLSKYGNTIPDRFREEN